jgi:hypothetical protein
MKDDVETEASPLVGKQACLEQLFPSEADRPTTRWLDQRCKRREIPFVRLGRLIYFNVPQVRRAIEQATVQPRGSRRVTA